MVNTTNKGKNAAPIAQERQTAKKHMYNAMTGQTMYNTTTSHAKQPMQMQAATKYRSRRRGTTKQGQEHQHTSGNTSMSEEPRTMIKYDSIPDGGCLSREWYKGNKIKVCH